jgi:hypothetical protein
VDLTDVQKELLKNYAPLDAVIREMDVSTDFCWCAIHGVSGAPSLDIKCAVVKSVIARKEIGFIQPVSLAHPIIEISREDRQKGFELLLLLIKKHNSLDFEEHYLCKELGPVDETEIARIFSAFEESNRSTRSLEAVFFLSKICAKNYLPLIKKLKEWINEKPLFTLYILLATEISKSFFEPEREVKNEIDALTELIETDLRIKGINISKNVRNFDDGTDSNLKYCKYIEYLLSLYHFSEIDWTKVKESIKKHAILASFLPELTTQLETGPIEHPLAYYLNYEVDAETANKKVQELITAEFAANSVTRTMIDLWELEENLKLIMGKPIKDEVKRKLTNQFQDTLSELSVNKLLGSVGTFELLPEKRRIDGKLDLKGATINVEIARPSLNAKLDYGQGGGMHPHGKASILKEKIERIKKIENGLDTPYLVIFDVSSADLRADNVKNFLFGDMSLAYTINKKTGETVNSQWFYDSTKKGILTDDDKLVSAVLLLKRTVTTMGVVYSSEQVTNPFAKNPIPPEIMDEILRATNIQIRCPLIRLF